MLNEREALTKIESWDEAELIYRDADRMRHGKLTEEELINRYSSNPYILNLSLHPEDFVSNVDEHYIADGYNTLISKHPRYCTMLFHTHSFFEMTYVLKGSCIQHFEDSASSLNTDDFCILSPETRHYIYNFDDSIIINILIRQSTFIDIFSDFIRENTEISRFFSDNLYAKKRLSFMLFHSGNDMAIRSNIIRMFAEELDRDKYSDSLITSLIRITFYELMRRYGDKMEIPRIHKSGNELYDNLIHFIYSNYATVTLQTISEHFHFSRQYCSKMIIELTGYSLSELKTQIRIRRGAELLKSTSMSIEEIGIKLGYENPETFIRAFRRVLNITPGAYRKKIEKQG